MKPTIPPNTIKLILTTILFRLVWISPHNETQAEDIEVRTVVLSGDSVPGSENLSYLLDRRFAMNNDGAVAFDSRLSNGQSAISLATSDGGISVLARTGDTPAGVPPGTTFHQFGDVLINDSGDVVFNAMLLGDSGSAGIWSSQGNSGLSLIARTGSVNSPEDLIVHGENVGTVKSIRNSISFAAWRTTPDGVFTRQIWQASSGELSQLVAQDDSHEFVLPELLGVNDAGETLFFSTHPGVAPGGGGPDDPNNAIWKFVEGRFQVIADSRSVDNAPGTNSLFRELVGQHLNNRGEVAIVGVLADRTTSGVFRYSDEDGLDSVVLAGQQIGESATRVSYVSDPLIDARGQVTFNAGLEDGRRGIWTASPVGGIRPILVADHELPGVPDSRFFSGTFVTNRHGQLAIHGVFFTEGDEVETGFFAQDVHGTLHKLIASGDSIEVAPGEFREIEAVNFSLSPSNNEDGGISHFNENGELAFIARFVDDSTGLFVASIPDLCDFDGDSLCGISDMNMITSIGDLTAGVSVGPGIDGRYDINGDKVVDVWDMDAWLLEAAARSGFLSAFLRGDANLDGKVDSIDLSVVNAHLFSLDGRWDHGDFNGDGIVDGSDFNFWNIHKQITISSLGQRVPEPNGMMNLAFFIAIAHYLMIRDRLIR